LAKAIELVSEFSSFKADVLNIANGKEILIKDAVSIFYSFFKSEVTYSFTGNIREGDPLNWVADISKLISFGYQPSIGLNEGLQDYYKWIIEDKPDGIDTYIK
jgi:UDP-glucose 4-epimerase